MQPAGQSNPGQDVQSRVGSPDDCMSFAPVEGAAEPVAAGLAKLERNWHNRALVDGKGDTYWFTRNRLWDSEGWRGHPSSLELLIQWLEIRGNWDLFSHAARPMVLAAKCSQWLKAHYCPTRRTPTAIRTKIYKLYALWKEVNQWDNETDERGGSGLVKNAPESERAEVLYQVRRKCHQRCPWYDRLTGIFGNPRKGARLVNAELSGLQLRHPTEFPRAHAPPPPPTRETQRFLVRVRPSRSPSPPKQRKTDSAVPPVQRKHASQSRDKFKKDGKKRASAAPTPGEVLRERPSNSRPRVPPVTRDSQLPSKSRRREAEPRKSPSELASRPGDVVLPRDIRNKRAMEDKVAKLVAEVGPAEALAMGRFLVDSLGQN